WSAAHNISCGQPIMAEFVRLFHLSRCPKNRGHLFPRLPHFYTQRQAKQRIELLKKLGPALSHLKLSLCLSIPLFRPWCCFEFALSKRCDSGRLSRPRQL